MKIIIIGRTGQLAREIARALPQGTEAVFLSRDDADLALPEAAASALKSQIDGADAIINAAAYTAVDRAETDAALAMTINATSPGAMAHVAAAHGVPFVHISTDYVFDGSGTTPWRPADTPAPISSYGHSKLAGEAAVRAAGGPHVILRTSWVFSAHGTNFVTTMLRLGATRPNLDVVADQIGGPTPVAALAHACLTVAAAIARDPALSGTYHFAGQPDISWANFARAIFAAAGLSTEVRDIPTADYPTPAKRPLNSRLDCSGITTAFGLSPPDWHEGLTQVQAELEARDGDP